VKGKRNGDVETTEPNATKQLLTIPKILFGMGGGVHTEVAETVEKVRACRRRLQWGD